MSCSIGSEAKTVMDRFNVALIPPSMVISLIITSKTVAASCDGADDNAVDKGNNENMLSNVFRANSTVLRSRY